VEGLAAGSQFTREIQSQSVRMEHYMHTNVLDINHFSKLKCLTFALMVYERKIKVQITHTFKVQK
jgi:hypothetical protein